MLAAMTHPSRVLNLDMKAKALYAKELYNNHRKGHINTKIMCIFTLTKATHQELITRNSICALRLSQPLSSFNFIFSTGFLAKLESTS